MRNDTLIMYNRQNLEKPCLVMGLSGWMDGGEVSTGSIKYLVNKLDAQKTAEIKPDNFYLYNFPGPMEVASLFRPHCKIEDGIIESYDLPSNIFYTSSEYNLVLFSGTEPNINWQQFSECVFGFCKQLGIERIYFIGSVAGLIPHTREPRLFCSVSHRRLKETFEHYGVKPSTYEGPASIITYMTSKADAHEIEMVSFVSTIPAYVHGYNPRCIASLVHRLTGILEIEVDFQDLRITGEQFEKKVNALVEQQPELSENINKLEEDYDNEIFDNEMGDLKNWLQQKGIRLD